MPTDIFSRDAVPVAVAPPPPGITPNFDNPETTAQDAYTLVAVGIAIAGALLIMRLYTKGIILRKFGWEDVAILLAFAFSTADCILILEGRKYGTGRHIWEIPVTTLVPNWGKIVTAAVVVYCPAIMFSKVAVLLCYLRISTKSLFRKSVYITIAVVFAYNIALMLSLIFACNPIAKSWDLTIMTGSCINRPAVYIANGVLNIVTDFAILSLPLPLIRGLQMPKRQKFLLAAMFSVGSLTCIVSIIRLKTLIPTLKAIDQTWAIAGPGNWIIVEINLAVACGCLSVIRPFLRHHFPMLVGETRNNRSSNYKASRSDYFSRGSGRVPDPASESNTRLSHGHNPLPSWDLAGYSHEVKASGSTGAARTSPPLSDDVELGDIETEQNAKTIEHSLHSAKRSGDIAHVHELPRPQDVRLAENSRGIVKTMEVNVRR